MSEWIDWHGGECPVKGYVVVDVKFRDGDRHIAVGRDLRWTVSEHYADIVSWRLSTNKAVEELTDKPLQIVDKPIISDGSSSSYYTFDITNKDGQTITVEVGDVCRAMVANDFDLSNIVKATRRLSEASQGRGKFGASMEYDCNKVVYFANEFKHWNKEKA